MSPGSSARRFPVGTGWVVGYALAFAVGVLAWFVSGEVTIGLILLFATGTPLGVSLERSIDTRPLTERERRVALFLTGAGLVVGVLTLVYVVLLARWLYPASWVSPATWGSCLRIKYFGA